MKDSAIITGDEVKFHKGKDIILPEGITYGTAKAILQRHQDDADTVATHKRTYPYRPYDGAVAASRVMKRLFGITIGAPTPRMFGGEDPPETRSVQISPTESVEVPWGRVYIPAFDKTIVAVSGVMHPENGIISYVEIRTPKKNAPMAREFLDAVGEELKTNSIYRGKAIVGTEEPEFLDLDKIKPDEIVFSDEVMSTLDGTLWSVIRHRKVLERDGVRIKRALLLEGPYGTGKTSAGQLTALEAVAHGWTFIAARPGKDDINDVLRTAKLYQPAVVLIEDVDNQASTSDKDAVAQLLETFDGVTAKGSQVALLMTTNHFDLIHKGMLRPGRIDAVVNVGGLDRAGVEKLVRSIVHVDRLAADVDFDKVYAAMGINVDEQWLPFFPAYVREALERAKTYAVGRLNGKTSYVLSTADLVGAAQSLYGQLRAQHEAEEGQQPEPLESAFRGIVANSLNKVEVLDYDDDFSGRLRVKK